MGRNLGPVLHQELENLDRDADSRRLAMKALRSYVKDLDSRTIPIFLAQVSKTKETGSLSGEYTISLYEVLARVHGPNIVPQIDSIMSTIVKTLASSGGTFPLQQACSRVVPAIARYGIDPTTPEDKKRHIIHSLCKPLSDCLLGSQECLTSGAALCLKALVDSNNWQFAADEMVNKVCQNVAGALAEKSMQTKSHIGLVMSLAKRNALIVEAYARLLMQSGLQILNAGAVEETSQMRLSAIQMINFLMKCLDSRSLYSELNAIIVEMEKCQSDQTSYVRGAAFEALQTARRISERGPKFERASNSVSGFDSSMSDGSRRRVMWSAVDQSSTSESLESNTIDFSVEYDSLTESPISVVQPSLNEGNHPRTLNRKLRSYENGGVDVSLKDGFFSEAAYGSAFSNSCSNYSGHYELNDDEDYGTDDFAGFFQRVNGNGQSGSTTPSPQKSHANVIADNISIYSTPRKLIHSLQDSNDAISDISENQTRRFRTPSCRLFQRSPAKNDQNGFSRYVKLKNNDNADFYVGHGHMQRGSESVSSTGDISAGANQQISHEAVHRNKTTECLKSSTERARKIYPLTLLFGLFALFAVSISLLLREGPEESRYLVPT